MPPANQGNHPQVMPIIAQQALPPERLSFDLAALPPWAAILTTADGRQHVVLRNAHLRGDNYVGRLSDNYDGR
ncbi:hypothetical protein [Mesorhizobium ciceri]|uniref:hypothetical protein n=1 Tax=Mesorhizobium TaxID=68287 RepID=UPI00047BDF16|nr:hypothetical protein [Mesorhizobium ciceri]